MATSSFKLGSEGGRKNLKKLTSEEREAERLRRKRAAYRLYVDCLSALAEMVDPRLIIIRNIERERKRARERYYRRVQREHSSPEELERIKEQHRATQAKYRDKNREVLAMKAKERRHMAHCEKLNSVLEFMKAAKEEPDMASLQIAGGLDIEP
ncbi:hypothetical protein CVT26_011643 [Gymnopilus dilepis]|uniref:Uncharacterized protein n=1 Tax=Gymnopilus dilepis TaxID=231916 RepID=A0A409WSL0_9AGAR|nr:hypothetical protein CVT26_011643 [Gymnopilus dilepis]